MVGDSALERGVTPIELAAMRPPRSEWRQAAARFARNRMATVGIAFLFVVALIAILAPLVAQHDPNEQDLLARLKPPTAPHWFGTDELGRDVFARTVYGARYSLFIGIAGSLGGLLVGV